MSGYSKLSREVIERARRGIAADNQQYPDHLVECPATPSQLPSSGPYKVMRSSRFMVQFYRQAGGVIRLSVNRTDLTSTGRWKEGITWDELQRLKDQAGFAEFDAIEIYPAAEDVVNDSNMRHLWVLPAKLPLAWRR